MRAHEFLTEESVDENWRQWAAGAAIAGAGALGGYQALKQPAPPAPAAAPATPAPAPKPMKQLKPLERVLVATATQAGLAGNELKQFLAQCAHETGNFTTLKEMGGNRYLAKRYDKKYNPAKAKVLGNVKPGDGVKYKGRGFIQLTGRYNYRKAGQALGLPLEQQPELVERPDIAAKVAVWFWQQRVQPRVSNFDDVPQSTRPINPALKGLPDRQKHYDQYQQVTLPKLDK
jgi:putative chitinase